MLPCRIRGSPLRTTTIASLQRQTLVQIRWGTRCRFGNLSTGCSVDADTKEFANEVFRRDFVAIDLAPCHVVPGVFV